MLRAFLIAAALLTAAGAAAQTKSGIEVESAWARATPGSSKDTAAYLKIANKGSTPDRLVSVSSPIAGKADLHETRNENGIMRMRPVTDLNLAPGQTVELKPSAEHIMLTGLKQALKAGDSFPLTLKFEKAGDVPVTVKVERAGAMGMTAPAGQMDHGAMDHGAMTPNRMGH
jgi:copper(I)-binding protein